MTIEMLIVEDNEKHRQDAEAYFANKAEVVDVTYAGTLREALTALQNRTYDGVISDIFFPSGYEGEAHRKIIEGLYNKIEPYKKGYTNNPKCAEATELWKVGQAMPPCGVLVAEEAIQRTLYFTLNTDSNHHGAATEPICTWLRRQTSPQVKGAACTAGGSLVVETGEMQETDRKYVYAEVPGEHKDWRAAYLQILTQIIEKNIPESSLPDGIYRHPSGIRYRFLVPSTILNFDRLDDEKKRELERAGIDAVQIIEQYKI